MRIQAASVACLALLALTGCALNTTATPSTEAGIAIQGKVHGGQQPIVGAHVYLLAANTTGYPGTTTASTQSISLLTSATGHSDTIGNYVLTGSDGSFSITGDYTCTANQQVYLYSLGGNPGAGTNSAAGLMAILGNCPGTTFPASTYVWINEVSTVAAAYAFAGFTTGPTDVSSSGTALAKTGIANAFANASNLVSLSTGAALATTPAGNGTVPQATINTLANILASCVNSNGTVSGPTNATPCYTLFYNAQNPNATFGVPTDTAQAAINIAHNPGANVRALYGISTPAVAFAPAVTTQPNDFTIALIFAIGGGGLTEEIESVAIDASGNAWIANLGIPSSGQTGSVTELSSLGAPISGSSGFNTGFGFNSANLAIDNFDNVWVTNSGIPSGEGLTPSLGSVTELSPTGIPLSGGSGYTTGGVNQPSSIAVDGNNHVWVENTGTGTVTLFGYLGYVYSGAGGFSSTALQSGSLGQIAIDGSSDAWVVNSGANDVAEFSQLGSNLSGAAGFPTGGTKPEEGVAIDNVGNVWITDVANNVVYKLSNSGSVLSPSGGYAGGGINVPQRLAIDGAGNVWISNDESISELTNSGVPVTGSSGYQNFNTGLRLGLAVDGSGDLWFAVYGGYGLYEVIGVAAPVVTPLAANLAAPYGNPASKP